MRHLVLADWHHDFWVDDKRDPFAGIEDQIASLDLCILAGDISNKPKRRWRPAFDHLTRLLPADRIHVFPGNHDFYQHVLDGEDRLAEIAAAAGVGYAQRREIISGNVRYLCATLWTDHQLRNERHMIENLLVRRFNDYRLIRLVSGGYRRIWPSDLVKRHLADRAWLAERMAVPFDGKTVVVTHHGPHPLVLGKYVIDEKDGADFAAFYASDMTDFIETWQPDEWLFGHIHDGRSVTIGRTRISNVSLGYPMNVKEPQERILRLIREVQA